MLAKQLFSRSQYRQRHPNSPPDYHLIAPELGGDPTAPESVGPPSQGHNAGAGPNNQKDSVESKLHTATCSGKVQRAAAQSPISANSTTPLAKLGLT